LRDILNNSSADVRLYAPGANLPNMLGVASTPPYLTFGPAVYVDPELVMPAVVDQAESPLMKTSPEQLDWLRRAGVTHVLNFKPLDRDTWPAELLWQGLDPFLNRAWGRTEPLYLYSLSFSPAQGSGRVRFEHPAPNQQSTVTEYDLHRVVINAKSESGGRLILTDLMFPGWHVTVDGEDAEEITAEKTYRAVDLAPGDHTVVWDYAPRSVYWGAAISVATLLIIAAIAHMAYWHPGRLTFFGTLGTSGGQES
jgi:hypothetical protein